MKLYTIASLNKGAGTFDHVMHCAKEYPSANTEMATDVAIGVIAAAIRSGLNEIQIDDVLDGYFDTKTSSLLTKIKSMYYGPDRRVHLWNHDHSGDIKLHPALAYRTTPGWTINRPY